LTKKIDPLVSNSAWVWWQRVFFFPLIFLAWLYHIFFLLSQRNKRLFTSKKRYPFTIISVGNIVVGGTGKSVVIPYLVSLLGEENCAILLRGYRGSNEATGKSFLVSDGCDLFCSAAVAGDEAVMHAVSLACPVVVGKNRAQSCDLLRAFDRSKKIKYVLLDDAYQHQSVKKDIELVLLDARKPFDNGYCLPLGRLREKDLSRATALVVTHADKITAKQRDAIKKALAAQVGHDRIFFGAHKPDGFFLNNHKRLAVEVMKSKTLCAVSGIGNSDNFYQMLTKMSINDVFWCDYPNHYRYSKKIVDGILVRAKSQGVTGMVTTSKDWVKIAPFAMTSAIQLPWYVLRVKFVLLDKSDEESFLELFK